MSGKLKKTAHLGMVLGVLGVAACTNTGPQTVADSVAYLAETTVGSINGALTDDEKSPPTGSGSAGSATSNAKTIKPAISRAIATASCGSLSYTPTLGSLTCSGTASGETVMSVLDCAIAQGTDVLLKGTVSLTFDDPVTCGEWLTGTPTSGAVTWTSAKLLRTTTDASGVTTSSNAVKNYKNVSIGGGITTAWSSTAPTSLNILGLHVLRQATGDVTVFDHTITSNGVIPVSGTLAAGTREIASGNVVIDHNIQKYTATGTITNLKWSAGCCVPTSGTIEYALTGSSTGDILVNFNTSTCGKIAIADATITPTSANPSPSPIPSGMAANYTTAIGGCQ
jgi:hypothetical protein